MSTSGGAGRTPGLLPTTFLADLRVAWPEREQEARELISKGHTATGIALLMYSLEIRIKTRICKHLRLSLLPRACKTHDLSELIIFTGLFEDLQDPAKSALKQNWDLLENFSRERLNDLRYNPRIKLTVPDSGMLLDALDDPAHGVLQWLSIHL